MKGAKMNKNNWQIIKQTSVQGVVEYTVSDGVVGERTFSYDFSTLKEAKDHLNKLMEGSEDE
jgi:hypothetical protein